VPNLWELQKRIVPDLTAQVLKRYHILRTIYHFQPMGRRLLAKRLDFSEREVRGDLEFLARQGLVHNTSAGAMLTPEGEKLLASLVKMVRTIQGTRDQENILKRFFGLDEVIIVPGQGDRVLQREELARQVGNYLHEKTGEEGVLAVTGGTTLAAVARVMKKRRKKRSRLTVVPGRGGLGEKMELEANTIAAEIAQALGAQYRLLYLPETSNPRTLAALKEEPAVAEVLDLLKKTDILLHGIGASLEMARRRRLPSEEIEVIRNRGAVGEAFGYYFNSKKEVVYITPSVGIRLEDLERIERVIAVAGGVEKTEAIMSAVNPLFQDVLITDSDAATAIVNKIKEEGSIDDSKNRNQWVWSDW